MADRRGRKTVIIVGQWIILSENSVCEYAQKTEKQRVCVRKAGEELMCDSVTCGVCEYACPLRNILICPP